MTAAALQLVQADVSAATPVNQPTDLAVYKIMGGLISRGTVNSKLAIVVVGESACMPAPFLPNTNETLAAVRLLTDRCVPWAQVYCGPGLWAYDRPQEDILAFLNRKSVEGHRMHEIGSRAWCANSVPAGKPEVILISTYGSTRLATSIVHH